MQPGDQKPEQGAPAPQLRRTRLHPARDFFGDWQEQEKQPVNEDVAWQPTVVLNKVKRSQNQPSFPQRNDIPEAKRAAANTIQAQLPTTDDVTDLSRLPTSKLPRPFVPETLDPSMLHKLPTHRLSAEENLPNDVFDVSLLSTAHIMQLSGMMRAVRVDKTSGPGTSGKEQVSVEEWWPEGIKQTGPLPVVNLYGNEPFGRTGKVAAVATPMPTPVAKPQPRWKAILNTPAAKVIIGLAIGISLLFLVANVVDIPSTVAILQKNLATPTGITLALLSGVAFLTAFCIRGVRWKLFLNPIGKVSVVKAVQLFLVGMFLNFLLPIRGGEVAKSLMLKRIAGIPISQSLPTVAMDKALDLMPALFIMALVPLIGLPMDFRLWLVLGMVGGLLIGLIFFIGLAAWKREAAIGLLRVMTGFLPKGLSSKIEGFATGFVDSLLAGASQPKIFIPAVLLTIVAVTFDGLFAMLAFWTVGEYIPFWTAIFGYTVFNMFYILPTPPGQVGSNQAIGLLVFYGLLHLDQGNVLAMFIFSHPWAALIQCVVGMICLSSLGLTISSAMKVQGGDEEETATPAPAAEQPLQVRG